MFDGGFLFNRSFITKCIATCFYIGTFPFAPGTLGSLVGLMLSALLLALDNIAIYSLTLLVLTTLGFWSSIIYAKDKMQRVKVNSKEELANILPSKAIPMSKIHDPSEVVIDEVVGQFLSVYLMVTCCEMYTIDSKTPFFLAVNFLLFRFFDIFKPYPLNKIDGRPGCLQCIMWDDIVAGVLSGACSIAVALTIGGYFFDFYLPFVH